MKATIQAISLSKLYRLGKIGFGSLQEDFQEFWDSLVGSKKHKVNAKEVPHFEKLQQGPRPNSFWALRDVSFETFPGEIVGVVGKNGSGKSTLLKVLSRITVPTEGRALIRGRLSALLEVGAGFQWQLSGRENVYLYGSILGMRRHEITKHFDEIVSFAEVEGFIETPVKHYSSGMYVRLAFSVATHLRCDVMILDEILAVADVVFQRKCLERAQALAKEGRTILLVSHDNETLNRLCNRCILLEKGRVAGIDSPNKIIARLETPTPQETAA